MSETKYDLVYTTPAVTKHLKETEGCVPLPADDFKDFLRLKGIVHPKIKTLLKMY